MTSYYNAHMDPQYMDAAMQLAESFYNMQENKCIPAWDSLEPNGATQGLWLERALAAMDEQEDDEIF